MMLQAHSDALTARFGEELRLGVFRNWHKPKGGGAIPLHHTVRLSENAEIEIRSSSILGRGHLDVFLGLCRLATINGVTGIETSDPLLSVMTLEGEDARRARKITIALSLRQIAATASRSTGGKALESLSRILEDLASVTLLARWIDDRGRKRRYVSSMIGFHQADDRVAISFHSLLGASISDDRYYSSITWAEREAIETPTARYLHSSLSSRISPGKTVKLSARTIMSDLFGEKPTISRQARNDRRKQVREAMAEVAGVGWTIQLAGPTTLKITRPAINEV